MSDETKPTEQITRTITLTELDAHIAERMKTQPQTLDDVMVKVSPVGDTRNRLSLPEEVEKYSYDCTRGQSCKTHKWVYDERTNRWSYERSGKFIFRWLFKHKRAIDIAINDRGWNLLNRRLFSDLPNHLFSANGGIEKGSTILAFLPVDVALKLRTAPVKQAQEILSSRISRDKESPDRFMMTGQPQPHQYMPKITPEREEGDDYAPPGSVQIPINPRSEESDFE